MKTVLLNLLIFALLILIVLSIKPSLSNNILGKAVVENEVATKITEEGSAKVVVVLREPERGGFLGLRKLDEEEKQLEIEKIKKDIFSDIGEEKIRYEYEKSFTAEISNNELEKLEDNRNVKEIKNLKKIAAFLQDSTRIVNATSVWNLQVSGKNITGQGETICLIDSGINYLHADLGGCLGTGCKVIAGWDFVNKDTDPIDDYGHGTHVAGIISGSGNLKGIAPDASLVALKVLDSSGSGRLDHLKAAIDWCVGNASIYNISVISMSLGTEPPYLYSRYCDYEYSSDPDIAGSINNAISKNISVIAATGNTGNKSHIASPACIEKSTSVAATTKQDNIASFSNRNEITDLVAPGENINSTYLTGYTLLSGTSMAAPHVAAAFALVNQFYKLKAGRILMPSEIQDLLNNTGKKINDVSTGLNFSRINIHEAVWHLEKSLDSIVPNVSLISPSNNLITSEKNISFKCNASDNLQLKSIKMEVWNSMGTYYNLLSEIPSNITTNFLEIELNLTNLPDGDYKWNCLAYDSVENSAYAEANFSLFVGNLNTLLLSPINNYFTNQNNQNFTCLSETNTNFELENVTFMIWNSTEVINSVTENITGTSNITNFQYILPNEAEYYWNCLAYNNVSFSSFANSNYTLIYDTSSPEIAIISPEDNYNTESRSIEFRFNVSDNLKITSCYLIVDNSILVYNSSEIIATNSIIADLDYGNHIWQINCSEQAGNMGNSSSRSLTINQPVVSSAGTGGDSGGGGGITSNTYIVNTEQINKGYTQELKKQDKIKFNLTVEGKAEEHELIVNEVKENLANITIKSKIYNVLILVGELKKFELTGDDYYDLAVLLNSIKNDKANLSLKTLKEPMYKVNKTQEQEVLPQTFGTETKVIKEYKTIKIIVSIIFLLLVIFVGIKIVKRKRKQKHGRKKSKTK